MISYNRFEKRLKLYHFIFIVIKILYQSIKKKNKCFQVIRI